MVASMKVFFHWIYHQNYFLDGMFPQSYRRYPDGQIDLPPELPLESPHESPECCDHPDQTLFPYPPLQKPAESKPVPQHSTSHSVCSSVPEILKTALSKISRDRHNLDWYFEVRKTVFQARTCSRTLALRRMLRTVSVGCAPSLRRLTMAGTSRCVSSVLGL